MTTENFIKQLQQSHGEARTIEEHTEITIAAVTAILTSISNLETIDRKVIYQKIKELQK